MVCSTNIPFDNKNFPLLINDFRRISWKLFMLYIYLFYLKNSHDNENEYIR